MRRKIATRLFLVALLSAASPAQVASRAVTDSPSAAARVRLRDGRLLRGDCEPLGAELILRNLAGELRFPRSEIESVEWLESGDGPAREFVQRLWEIAADDFDAHFALAQWALEQRRPEWARRQAELVLAARPEHEGARTLLARIGPPDPVEPQPASDRAPRSANVVPPPPLLTDASINRLKLYEYARDGAPEPVSVRFRKARGEPDVEELARREATRLSPPRPELLQALEKGDPPARLQAILSATGMQYADRLEISGDTRVFKEFRTRVLPNITRGCARSGCHGGTTNYVFRFPVAPQSGDPFVYTTYALLDGMRTAGGRMIDRDLPEASELPRLMLAGPDGRSTHPPVKVGRVNAVFQSSRDPGYRDLLAWISSLRVPHPEYELTYRPLEREPASRPTATRPGRIITSAPAAADEADAGAEQP